MQLLLFSLQDSDSYSDDDDSQSHSRRRIGRPNRPLTFKRRAKILFKTLMDYMTEDGRQPIVAFIEKPAKREYPDYYEVQHLWHLIHSCFLAFEVTK